MKSLPVRTLGGPGDGRTRGRPRTANLCGVDLFIGSDALVSGQVSRHFLRTRFTAVYPDVYLPRDVEMTAVLRAQCAWLWTHRSGIVAGRAAAALHGAKWIEARFPAEVIHPNRRPPNGIKIWSDGIAADETQNVGGIAVTSPARTMFDIACRYSRLPAVKAMDALARATGVTAVQALAIAARYPGRRHIRRAREALLLVDGGSESPQETWLRLLVISGGVPPPQTQVRVFDEYGQVVARLDMAWPELKIALEYDGDHHWTNRGQLQRDIRRTEMLRELGWIVIRVTALDTDASILGRVAAAFARRTCV